MTQHMLGRAGNKDVSAQLTCTSLETRLRAQICAKACRLHRWYPAGGLALRASPALGPEDDFEESSLRRINPKEMSVLMNGILGIRASHLAWLVVLYMCL